jgi:hypothetical protein
MMNWQGCGRKRSQHNSRYYIDCIASDKRVIDEGYGSGRGIFWGNLSALI